MPGPRKCKVCGKPVKNHPGPTGVGNCKNQVDEEMEGGPLGEKPVGEKPLSEKPGKRIVENEESLSLEERGDEDGTQVDAVVKEVEGSKSKVKEDKAGVKAKPRKKKGDQNAAESVHGEKSTETPSSEVEAAGNAKQERRETFVVAPTFPKDDQVDHTEPIGSGRADGAEEAGFGCNNLASDSDDTEVSHFLPSRKVLKLYFTQNCINLQLLLKFKKC